MKISAVKNQKEKEMYLPDSASEQCQSPHSRGPHKIQKRISSVFIFYRYFFGQNLESKKETLVKADINTE